jgi:hypothetical protein
MQRAQSGLEKNEMQLVRRSRDSVNSFNFLMQVIVTTAVPCVLSNCPEVNSAAKKVREWKLLIV